MIDCVRDSRGASTFAPLGRWWYAPHSPTAAPFLPRASGVAARAVARRATAFQRRQGGGHAQRNAPFSRKKVKFAGKIKKKT